MRYFKDGDNVLCEDGNYTYGIGSLIKEEGTTTEIITYTFNLESGEYEETSRQIRATPLPEPIQQKTIEEQLAEKDAEIKALKQQVTTTATDLQGFMDFYFSINP